MSRTSFNLFALGAVALVGLFACQKEARETNPNFNSKTNEVNAQFVFNLSSLAKTKQSGDKVQEGGTNFRGISEAILMALASSSEDAAGKVKDSILVSDCDVEKSYDFPSLNTRIIEMSVPLRTDVLLFYGKAPAGSGADAYDEYGHLDKFSITKTANTTNIQLGRRLSSSESEIWNKKNFLATEKVLAGILTLIMNTTLSADFGTHEAIDAEASPGESKPYGFDIPADKYPNIKWSDYAGNVSPYETTHVLYPLEEKLGHLYTQMTTIRSDKGELRAASGDAVRKIIQDLWSVINSVRCAAPTSEAEAVAKYFATVVDAFLDKYFNATGSNDEGNAITSVSFEAMSTILTNLRADADIPHDENRYSKWPSESGSDSFKPSDAELTDLTATGLTNALVNFPFNFHIPRGASYMAYNTAGKYFHYPQEFNVSGMGGNGDNSTYNAENYYYPAELIYFGNSPVRISEQEHKNDYPSSNWELDKSWPSKSTSNENDWTGYAVTSSTRSVAMKHNINYGVAMLQANVKYGASTIYDNRQAVLQMEDRSSTEANQTIIVDNTSFKLTGIIIGGQPQNIGWDCLPIKDPSDTRDIPTYGFIYDKAIPETAQAISANSGSGSNYTIVFDNYNDHRTDNKQDVVYVALEFQNNTQKDIYGNANIIKNGGYFYLIGALDPAAASSAVVWPTIGARIPPYNTTNGSRTNVTRVFIQDFVTKATFTFGQESLKGAYLTVPDLRASSLTLGLSVDLNWQQGLVYDNVPLGGTTSSGSGE